MASEPIKAETAKRSPSPTVDSLAAEEQSSAMKKHKVDEEEEGFSDSDPYVSKRDPEPEWDKDSYDGRVYESDPEIRELFSDEDEYTKYKDGQLDAIKSGGFICAPLSGNYPIKDEHMEEEVYENVTVRQVMTDLANLCVQKFNEEKRKTVELVEIVRVIPTGGGTRKYYITFMARESPNGPPVEYQAKVLRYAGNWKPPFPILCRPSPKPSI